MAYLSSRPRNGGVATRSPLSDFLGWDPFRNFVSPTGMSEVEITRTETGYSVELPVAGYRPEQVEVTLDDHVLTITGNSEKRQFSRSLLLPDEIDTENIGAKVEHGMLVLTLNFHAKAQPKKIEVHSN